MTTGAQFRDYAVAKRGYRYEVGPTRTTGSDGYFDCSGLITYAAHMSGIQSPNVSWAQALWCRDHGTLLDSVHTALSIPGCLLFEGPDRGYGGFGNDGHVAITMGDGANIIEAKGHAWGVLVDGASGRPWSNQAKVPGLSYGGSPALEVIKVHQDYAKTVGAVSQCVFKHPVHGYASAVLDASGAVYCSPPQAYIAGANGKPYFAGRHAAAIRPITDGYAIWSTSGERYAYPFK